MYPLTGDIEPLGEFAWNRIAQATDVVRGVGWINHSEIAKVLTLIFPHEETRGTFRKFL